MGSSSPSKLLDSPQASFSNQRHRRRSLTDQSFRKKGKNHDKDTTLLQYIAHRDWQNVLIRASLHPSEAISSYRMELYGVEWDLYAIHLACALQPPPQVIASLLMEQKGSTAAIPLKITKKNEPRSLPPQHLDTGGQHATSTQTSNTHKKTSRGLIISRLLRRSLPFLLTGNGDTHGKHSQAPDQPSDRTRMNRPIKSSSPYLKLASSTLTWTPQHRDGAYTRLAKPIEKDRIESSLPAELSFTTGTSENIVAVTSAKKERNSTKTTVESLLARAYNQQNDNTYGTSLDQFLREEGELLQLTETGGLCITKLHHMVHAPPTPTPFNLPSSSTMHIENTRVSSQRQLQSPHATCIHNLVPPNETMATANINLEVLLRGSPELLPLHIACLYRASPEVLSILLDTNNVASRKELKPFEMLPIHLVCAGITLPPPCLPFARQERMLSFVEEDSWDLVEVLAVLVEAYPESISSQSIRDGFTPLEYMLAREIGCSKESSVECRRILGYKSLEQTAIGAVYMAPDPKPPFLSSSKDSSEECLRVLGYPSQDCTAISAVSVASNTELPSLSSNSVSISFRLESPSTAESTLASTPSDEDSTTSSYSMLIKPFQENTVNAIPSLIEYTDCINPFLSLTVGIKCSKWQAIEGESCSTNTQDYGEKYSNNHAVSQIRVEDRGTRRLHMLLMTQDWVKCKELLVDDPNQAREWDIIYIKANPHHESDAPMYSKRLPIHNACAFVNTPSELIRALIAIYPLGLSIPDPYNGSLPLHLLAHRHTSSMWHQETAAILLRAYPEAIQIPDTKGRLPLHHACLRVASLFLVQTLAKAHPESMWSKDTTNCTPLDHVEARIVVEKDLVDNQREHLEAIVSFLEEFMLYTMVVEGSDTTCL